MTPDGKFIVKIPLGLRGLKYLNWLMMHPYFLKAKVKFPCVSSILLILFLLLQANI